MIPRWIKRLLGRRATLVEAKPVEPGGWPMRMNIPAGARVSGDFKPYQEKERWEDDDGE